ncbi:MAG: VTT domain-containing protein [Candidatus Dependentiae bacterium]|nr:VTT domain-containing protein [Candidatus Dependentiae bacterium]
MKKIIKRIIIVLFIIAAFFALRSSGIYDYVSLSYIKSQQIHLQDIISHNYCRSAFLYIFLYIIIVAFSLPLAAIMSIAGGFFFGTLLGALYTNIGSTVGSVIAFLTFRYVIGEAIQNRYKKELASFNKHMHQDGTLYLLVIHFIIGIPLFMVNFLAAMTNVSLSTFIWTTSLGVMLPSFVFTFAGQQLTVIETVGDIFSPPMIAACVFLALLAFLPIVIKKMGFLHSNKI